MKRLLNTLLIVGLQLTLSNPAMAQAAAQFHSLENKYLDAEELSLSFRVTATGAVQAAIEGSLRKTAAGSIYLAAIGTFAGQDIDLIAEQNEEELRFGARSNPQTVEPASHLWEALVLGFTRMGILHNIATLSAGAAPDHSGGGVNEWVVVENVLRDAQTYSFAIIVAGQPSGSAKLVVDAEEIPILREQIVAFPGGEMQVEEAYSNISID